MGDMPNPPEDKDVILQDEPDDEQPEAALPSAWFFRGSLLTLAVGTALTVFLIASPPESAGQAEPVRAPATATRAPASPTATATPPGATASVEIPAPSPTPEGGSPTVGNERTHVIAAGDTLSGIAALYDTTVDAIIALNPGLDPNQIAQGDSLRIPPAP